MAIINPGDVPINENQVDGTELARRLERLYSAFHSQNSGAARPPSVTAGAIWSKTATGGFDVMMFDGTNDIKIGGISNGTSNFGGFESGTRMLFQQTAAPVGWTKQTDQNDAALRVVSAAVSSGGSMGFTTAFATRQSAGHTLTEAQIPLHGHGVNDPGHGHGINDGGHTHAYRLDVDGRNIAVVGNLGNAGGPTIPLPDSPTQGSISTATAGSGANVSVAGSGTGITIAGAGGNQAHAHGIDLAVKYVDVIIASKD
jgi:hypothetical protein